MVSLKYFFNFDPSCGKYVFLIALLLPDLFKLFLAGITAYFYVGVLTVKEDTLAMQAITIVFKERWDNSELREALVNNTRTLRNNFPDNDFRIWR